MLHVTDTQSEKEKNWVKACELYLQTSCNQERRGKVLQQLYDYICTGKLPSGDNVAI